MATSLNPIRVVSCIFVLFIAVMIKSIVLFPSVMEIGSKNNPEIKRQYDEFKRRLEDARPAEAPAKTD
jgi:F0F1-type ATP synthase membrane subunit b/b'